LVGGPHTAPFQLIECWCTELPGTHTGNSNLRDQFRATRWTENISSIRLCRRELRDTGFSLLGVSKFCMVLWNMTPGSLLDRHKLFEVT